MISAQDAKILADKAQVLRIRQEEIKTKNELERICTQIQNIANDGVRCATIPININVAIDPVLHGLRGLGYQVGLRGEGSQRCFVIEW